MQQPGVAMFLLEISVFLLLVIAGPIILILRMTPGYKKAREKSRVAESDAAKINADYTRAGFQVKKGFASRASVKGMHAGVIFTHNIYPPGRNTPSKAVVSIPSAVRGDFSITRGRTIEAKTGDTAFDNDFYLRGISYEFVQAVFADARNRDAVRAIFKLGFERVELDGSELSASNTQGMRLLDLAVVTATVEQLAGLRTAGIAPYRGITRKHVQKFIVVCVILAIQLGLFTYFCSRPLVDGWWGAAIREWKTITVVAVVFVLIAAISLKGRTFELLAALFLCVPALIVTCWCLAVLANQFFDESAIAVHELKLLRNYKERYKRATYFYIELESWRNESNIMLVKVTSDVYAKVESSRTATLGVRAGRLGIEWIYSVNNVPL